MRIEDVVDAALEGISGRAGLTLCGLYGELPHVVESLVDVAASGLGRTVHAGEGRPPREIAEAIELLHAQRIGHGITLLDDPRVTDLVITRGVVHRGLPNVERSHRGDRACRRSSLARVARAWGASVHQHRTATEEHTRARSST